MKKTYRVPIELKMQGYQTVDADSYEEAVQFMLDKEEYLTTPTIATQVEGSIHVLGEDKYGKNAAAIATMHEEAGLNVLPRDTAVNRTMFTDTITKL